MIDQMNMSFRSILYFLTIAILVGCDRYDAIMEELDEPNPDQEKVVAYIRKINPHSNFISIAFKAAEKSEFGILDAVLKRIERPDRIIEMIATGYISRTHYNDSLDLKEYEQDHWRVKLIKRADSVSLLAKILLNSDDNFVCWRVIERLSGSGTFSPPSVFTVRDTIFVDVVKNKLIPASQDLPDKIKLYHQSEIAKALWIFSKEEIHDELGSIDHMELSWKEVSQVYTGYAPGLRAVAYGEELTLLVKFSKIGKKYFRWGTNFPASTSYRKNVEPKSMTFYTPRFGNYLWIKFLSKSVAEESMREVYKESNDEVKKEIRYLTKDDWNS